ncbi:putative ABC transporter ATP-binding protein [Anaerohalosphaera lusitana]|uniref:Putative ABC transporter ATP-binding protein n=1 Tax=Anaerohalosphaera lusitana TaxID=1936003 RepID=A0A1U9NMA0_9BACT|nr:ABC transporter ATP-binding protein [Anaerohalosphaera lusitana]AQT68636.1 putative ABC transporter ATP-binding protein [Anaerohalosphaera lusitana]
MKFDNSKIDGIIRIEKLIKKFDSRVVLDGISLSCEEGKTTVIIGPSGCGKTVLMKHMIALERPTEGQVYFKEQRIDEMHEKKLARLRLNFGFLFQGGALFDSLNVYENIIFPLRQHTKIKDWDAVDELVKQKLALVGMDGYQNHMPANLSGGQQKRVALARAIALNPQVILYDEPTTGLDPIRSDIINELILKLQQELTVTSVVVTHDMNSAYKIADRIIMLHNGKIVADGDAEHIRNHPNDIVQQFINGRVGEAELAALRHGGTKFTTQFKPEDFK